MDNDEKINAFWNSSLRTGSEANFPEVEELEGFTPTRYELLQLAHHWADVAMQIDTLRAFSRLAGGSSISPRKRLAWSRISRIVNVVGEEEVKGVVTEVIQECAENCDARVWNEMMSHPYGDNEAAYREIMKILRDAASAARLDLNQE